MNYLLLGKTGHDRTFDWLSYFDVVMVGCGKPGFFGSKGQLFQVDLASGLLKNLDNGAPTVPLEEPDSPRPTPHDLKKSMSAPEGLSAMDQRAMFSSPMKNADVYQGGCYKDLHRMLGVKCGSEVLYAGDHILGDVLKSKKTVGWRTMLLIPELDVDISLQEASDIVFHELAAIRAQREAVDDEIQRLETSPFMLMSHVMSKDIDEEASSSSVVSNEAMIEQLHSPKAKSEMIERLRYKREGLQRRHSTMLGQLHQRYHPVWGMLFKTGSVTSRFAEQCEKYGCLYTTHISNLAFYSPNKSYKGREGHLAHENLEEIS